MPAKTCTLRDQRRKIFLLVRKVQQVSPRPLPESHCQNICCEHPAALPTVSRRSCSRILDVRPAWPRSSPGPPLRANPASTAAAPEGISVRGTWLVPPGFRTQNLDTTENDQEDARLVGENPGKHRSHGGGVRARTSLNRARAAVRVRLRITDSAGGTGNISLLQ